MNRKHYYQVLRSDYLRNQVFSWWARLQGQEGELKVRDQPGNPTLLPRGIRAELHRCHQPDDALLTEGFRVLWLAVNKDTDYPGDMIAWATVAAVLADVRNNSELPFAGALGSQKDKTGKPYMSELRFSQLQKSADSHSFLRRMRRSVALLGGNANVLSLSDSILHWHREKQGHYAEKPQHRLAVRWATDYFTALSEYQR